MFFWFLLSSHLFAWKQKMKRKHRANDITVKTKQKNIYIYILPYTLCEPCDLQKDIWTEAFGEWSRVSVSKMKDNAGSAHSEVNTNTQCTWEGFTTTFTKIRLKNPSCENSCYANKIVRGYFFTRLSWNSFVKSLRTFRAWMTFCSLRLKWVLYVWLINKEVIKTKNKKVCVATCPHFVFLLLLSLVSLQVL